VSNVVAILHRKTLEQGNINEMGFVPLEIWEGEAADLVLAVWPGRALPFVSWVALHRSDGSWSLFYGAYFASLAQAQACHAERKTRH
jgi:hypothetical protein